MDPFQQQPPPVGELASTLAATNQAVNATTGINIATSDPAASTRVTPAPAVDGTSAEGAIGVNSSDSPLSDSSEERVRYSHWDVVRRLLQPEAPGNPHLQLQGSHLATQNIFILIVGWGDDPLPVDRRTTRRLVPARSGLPHDT